MNWAESGFVEAEFDVLGCRLNWWRLSRPGFSYFVSPNSMTNQANEQVRLAVLVSPMLAEQVPVEIDGWLNPVQIAAGVAEVWRSLATQVVN